jgi:predicted CoA-binding protein
MTSRATGERRGTGSSRRTHEAERSSANAVPSLRDIDVKVDVVDVFRPPEEAEGIAGEAIAIGAKTLWFQPGTHTDEAIALARAAGLRVVPKRSMGVTHGWLGLAPGPHVSSVA